MPARPGDTPPLYDVYAQELLHYNYGHPLWNPEDKVALYDVGYVREGTFHCLFNADNPPSDSNLRRYIQPASSSESFRPHALTMPWLCGESLSVRNLSIGGNVEVHGMVGVNSEVQFTNHKDSGALLLLKGHGHKTSVSCELRLKRYMKENVGSWLEYARSKKEVDLGQEDIVFVYGFTKTAVWAETAFYHATADKAVSLSGTCTIPTVTAGGKLMVQFSNVNGPRFLSREGPPELFRKWDELKDDDIAPDQCDQCIFVEYYVTPKRKPWWKIWLRARAGPHELPPGTPPTSPTSPLSHSDHSEPEADVMSATEYLAELYGITLPEAFNPVAKLLDYVLEHSDAELAIVSDSDLACLTEENGHFPSDVGKALEALHPDIVQESYGGRTVAFLPFAVARCHIEPHAPEQRKNDSPIPSPRVEQPRGSRPRMKDHTSMVRNRSRNRSSSPRIWEARYPLRHGERRAIQGHPSPHASATLIADRDVASVA